MLSFIYDNPTWVWGTILVIVVVAVSCTGLLVFNRIVHPERRVESTDACVAVFSVTGTVYAVLIAFVAIAAWEAFGEADKIVQTEASIITNMYRDIADLDKEDVDTMRGLLRDYTQHVVTVEWAAQMEGTPIDHRPGRKLLDRMHHETMRLNHRGGNQALVQAEVFRDLNELYKARRARHIAAGPDSGIPAILWTIIAIGTALTIFASYLLPAGSVRIHLLLTAIGACSIALVIVLVLALDRPFRGELSVAKDAFEMAIDSMRSDAGAVKKNN